MSKAITKLSAMERIYHRPVWYETKKLEARCKEIGVDPPTFAPMDNNVVCWRLPPLEMSRGGIVIPSEHASPHIKGILMAVGPRARDVLFSNGIELGDIVIWARFSGWELKDKTVSAERADEFCVLKDRDILGSDDLAADLANGRAAYQLDDKTGRYCLTRKMLGSRKVQKLRALAASTTNPHEAETARRLADEIK
jgi:co-chaperonin GroES (HSP10)